MSKVVFAVLGVMGDFCFFSVFLIWHKLFCKGDILPLSCFPHPFLTVKAGQRQDQWMQRFFKLAFNCMVPCKGGPDLWQNAV